MPPRLKRQLTFAAMAAILFFVFSPPVTAQSGPDTGFTYQGLLQLDGADANGSFDFQFAVYQVEMDGQPLAPPVDLSDITVDDGLFKAKIDFGFNVFAGSEVWLEVRVREAGTSDAYRTLSPRQAITPIPLALHARNVDNNAIGTAQIAPDAVTSIQINSQAVTSSEIKDGGVESQDLAIDAVTGAKVLDGSITLDDLAQSGCGGDQIIRWDSGLNAWVCSPDRSIPSHFGRFGGNGVDGSMTVSGTSSLPSGSYQFTDLTIESTGTLQLDDYTMIGVQGICEIRGVVTAAGAGSSGATATGSAGHNANPFASTGDQPIAGALSGAGGSGGYGGGGCLQTGYAVVSGKGGGAAGFGGQALLGEIDGNLPSMDPSVLAGPNGRADHVLSVLQFRGAGGGGGSCISDNEACVGQASGGNGGGVIYLECGELIFGETVFDPGNARIDVSGAAGSSASCSDSICCVSEGGGGGGGGVALVRTKRTRLVTGVVDDSGGLGGTGSASGSGGTAGAQGGIGAEGYSVIVNVRTNAYISTSE